LQLELTEQVQVELRADVSERRTSRAAACNLKSSHRVRQVVESCRGVIVEYTLVVEFSIDQVPQESVVDIGIFVTVVGLRCIGCFVKITFRIVDQCDSQAHGLVAFFESRDILGFGVNAFRVLSPALTFRCDDGND